MKTALKALILQEGKSPVIWAALISAAVAWPITLDYSPLAASLGSANAKDIAYDLAFVLALAGGLYSSATLSSKSWLLSRASGPARFAISFGWISLGAFLPALISLTPLALLTGVSVMPGIASMALIALHLAALLLILDETGLSHSERSLALLLLALALPASLSGETGTFSYIGRVLNPAAGGDPGDINLLLTAHQFGSIIALTLIALALKHVPALQQQ